MITLDKTEAILSGWPPLITEPLSSIMKKKRQNIESNGQLAKRCFDTHLVKYGSEKIWTGLLWIVDDGGRHFRNALKGSRSNSIIEIMRYCIFLLTALIIASCSQEDSTITSTFDISEDRTTCTNTLDSIGQMHNSLVLQLLEEIQFSSSQVDVQEAITEVLNHNSMLTEYWNPISGMMDCMSDSCINIANISFAEKEYLSEIRSVLMQADTDLDQVIVSIKEIECNVLNDNFISKDQESRLLVALTIARHSYELWTFSSEGGLQGMSSIVFNGIVEQQDDLQIRLDPCRTAIGVTAWSDVWGGFWGTVFGGPIGGAYGAATSSTGAAAANANNFRDC